MNMKNNIETLQKTELEILKVFVNICNKNKLTYYLSGGTYLGAVRHKGFIPWDDDIDVAMPREDYDIFASIAERQLPKSLKYQNYQNTDGYLHYFARVVDDSVKVVNKSAKKEVIESAWIDIFPLDGVPDNRALLPFYKFRLLTKRALLQYSCFDELVNLKAKNRPFIEKAMISIGKKINIGKFMNPRKRLDKIDKALRKYPSRISKSYVNFMGSYKFKSIISKDVYGDGALYDFEGGKYNAPANYDAYLTQIYGDYMTPPKEDNRDKHNTEILS